MNNENLNNPVDSNNVMPNAPMEPTNNMNNTPVMNAMPTMEAPVTPVDNMAMNNAPFASYPNIEPVEPMPTAMMEEMNAMPVNNMTMPTMEAPVMPVDNMVMENASPVVEPMPSPMPEVDVNAMPAMEIPNPEVSAMPVDNMAMENASPLVEPIPNPMPEVDVNTMPAMEIPNPEVSAMPVDNMAMENTSSVVEPIPNPMPEAEMEPMPIVNPVDNATPVEPVATVTVNAENVESNNINAVNVEPTTVTNEENKLAEEVKPENAEAVANTEEPKKKSNKTLIIIIVIVIAIAIGAAIFFLTQKDDTPTPVTPDTNGEKQEVDPAEEVFNNFKSKVQEVFIGEETKDNLVIRHELALLNDGTYLYYVGTPSSSASEGTYTIDSTMVILNENKVYGSDSCYYTRNNPLVSDYVYGDTLTVGENVTLNKATSDNLSNDGLKVYVTNQYADCGAYEDTFTEPVSQVEEEKQEEVKETIEVSKITLDKEKMSMAVGDKAVTLTATVKPKDATDKTVTWESNNESVAKVDNKGKVTAVAPGTAIIYAKTSNELAAKCTVTIKEKVETPKQKTSEEIKASDDYPIIKQKISDDVEEEVRNEAKKCDKDFAGLVKYARERANHYAKENEWPDDLVKEAEDKAESKLNDKKADIQNIWSENSCSQTLPE